MILNLCAYGFLGKCDVCVTNEQGASVSRLNHRIILPSKIIVIYPASSFMPTHNITSGSSDTVRRKRRRVQDLAQEQRAILESLTNAHTNRTNPPQATNETQAQASSHQSSSDSYELGWKITKTDDLPASLGLQIPASHRGGLCYSRSMSLERLYDRSNRADHKQGRDPRESISKTQTRKLK